MDEAVAVLAVEDELVRDLLAFDVAGGRWRGAYGVILEDMSDLGSALIPVGGGLYLLPVIHGHDVGELGADGELIDAGHGAEGAWNDREWDFFGVGERGNEFGVGLGGGGGRLGYAVE